MRGLNLYLSILLIFLVSTARSQSNEGAIWYFGATAGLTWCTLQTNGDPTPLMDGLLTTNEGVATIATAACELVFYTDGITVWAADHSIMPNTLSTSVGGSLNGDPSSTQSGVIVPQPLNPDVYYLFAVGANLSTDGLSYSRVDMTLNGGLGDIDPAVKNVQLFTPSTEKITAVSHNNGLDIWVITHEYGNSVFRTYKVTAGGFNPAFSVVSSIGAPHVGGSDYTRGYLKAAPSGTKIVVAVEGGDFYELFDFNNSTGELTDNVYLSNGYAACYGVEFSPDETYLYASERWGTPLRQFDITLPNANIQGSQIQIATLGTAYGGSLQLAVDSKIYLARSSTKYLGRINDPLANGAGTNYVDQGILLGPDVASARQSREGLPTFITSFFVPADFTFDTQCDRDTVWFYIPNPQGLDMAYWNFNYPTTNAGWHMASAEDTVFFIYPQGGVYEVQLITDRDGVLDTTQHTVYYSQYPDPNLGPNQTLCTNETISYDFSFNDDFAIDGIADYSWTAQIGGNTYYDSSPTYLINKPGTYTLSIYVDSICGSMSDQITVVYNNVEANLGVDINSGLCQGNSVQTLDATYSNPNFGVTYYEWSTFSISPTINVSQNGCYSVTLTLDECEDRDTICVHFDTPLVSPLGPNQYLCNGTTDSISALNTGASYLWNTGAQTQSIAVSIPGTYTVTVNNACGTLTDNIVYTALAPPVVNLGPDITICQGSPELVSASTGFPFETYLWSTNQITSSIAVTTSGYYYATVTNQCGAGSDQVYVYADQPLNNILGPDTSVCAGYVLDTQHPNADFFWSNGATTQSVVVNQPGYLAVEVTNFCGTYSDDITLDIITMEQVLPASSILCEGAVLVLDAGNPGSSYFWSTGNMSQEALVNFPGTYTVTVTNVCESNVYETDVLLFETTLDLGDDQIVCQGNPMTLDAGAGHPGATFHWSTGASSPTITVNSTGVYAVTVYSTCGEMNDAISLDVVPSPSVNFDQDTIITSDPEVLLIPAISNATAYQWSDGSTTETLLVTQSGLYTITVIDGNNCSETAQIYVELNVGIETVNLERAVTLFPNPVQDILHIRVDNVQVKEIAIYSSIGEVIKRFDQVEGTQQFDTYSLAKGVYFVKVESTDGHMVIKPFTVIR